jgi:hypothetical protein
MRFKEAVLLAEVVEKFKATVSDRGLEPCNEDLVETAA